MESFNEFIVKFKAEITAEILAEIRTELKIDMIINGIPDVLDVGPKMKVVSYYISGDWIKLEKNAAALECFTKWYESDGHSRRYKHLKHAFNSLLKYENWITMNLTLQRVSTSKNTW